MSDIGTIDIRDAMDTFYGVGKWSQRTAQGVGSDIGPAATAALRTLRASCGRGTLKISPGCWLYGTAIPASDLSGHRVEGGGSMASQVVYNCSSGVAFQWTAADGYSGGGMKGIALLLESGLGDTNAYGVLLRGDASHQPDQTQFEDIYVSAVGGSSFWYEGFHADGTARTAPQGIRVVTVRDLQVFNCRNAAVYLSGIVQWSMDNVGTYTGKGGGGDVYVTGLDGGLRASVQVELRNLKFGGALRVNNCDGLDIDGVGGSVYIDSTARHVRGWLESDVVNGAPNADSDLKIRSTA